MSTRVALLLRGAERTRRRPICRAKRLLPPHQFGGSRTPVWRGLWVGGHRIPRQCFIEYRRDLFDAGDRDQTAGSGSLSGRVAPGAPVRRCHPRPDAVQKWRDAPDSAFRDPTPTASGHSYGPGPLVLPSPPPPSLSSSPPLPPPCAERARENFGRWIRISHRRVGYEASGRGFRTVGWDLRRRVADFTPSGGTRRPAVSELYGRVASKVD